MLFFGVPKGLAGQAEDSFNLPERALLQDVLSYFEARIPGLNRRRSALLPSGVANIKQLLLLMRADHELNLS